MNRLYIDTGQTITRGTAFPLVLELPFDLDGWKVTFTMRTSIADLGTPILQCDSDDHIHMSVSGKKVTVQLADTDTWKIPEKAEQIFIQINLEKLVEKSATFVYAMSVGPNIMEVLPAR